MIDTFGIDVAIKATAILGIALAAHAVLGRRRALARSAIWNACLIGLLILPASSFALFPRLVVSVPRSNPAPATSPPAIVPNFPSVEMPIATGPQPEVDRAKPSSPAPTLIERPTFRTPDTLAMLSALYLTVTLILAARLALSMVAVGRWCHRCLPVEEMAWVEALERWRIRLGIARPVALRGSDRVSVPVTVGWLRPSIVLPERLVGDRDSRLVDSVLLHELAHIRRADYGWNLVRKLVQILYWPHPMTWFLGRIIGSVREQACDDLCIHVMGGSSGYRASLIAVASGLIRRPEPSIGLAMARTTNLGRRLAWIDRSPGSKRCVMRLPGRFAIATVVVALAGVIGSIELVQASPAQIPVKPEVVQEADVPDSIEVVVVAKETGKPIEGATLGTSSDFVPIEMTSDREGKVRIDLSRRKLRETVIFDVSAEGFVQQRHWFSKNDSRYPKIPSQFRVELLPGEETLGGIVKDEQGKRIAGVTVKIWGYLGSKKEKSELAYRVAATTNERGEWRCRCFRSMKFAYLYLSHPDYIADDGWHPRPHGQPIPSEQPRPGNMPIAGLRDFSDTQILERGVEVAGTVVDEQGKAIQGAEVGCIVDENRDTFHPEMPKTTTDIEGRFRFPHVKAGKLALQVKARGHAPALKVSEAKAVVEPVTIPLGPPRTIKGRVVDSAGKPIPEAFVTVDTWRRYRALGIYLSTDADGRFRWDDAPSDPVFMNATHVGFNYLTMKRVSPEDVESVLTLRRTLSIKGTISDSLTGKRIDQVQVEIGTPDIMTGQMRWEQDGQAFATQGQLHADLDAERAVEYRLRFRAKGYETFESRPFRSGEGQVEYDVRMIPSDAPPTIPISGVVQRPDGRPLEGAEVAVTYQFTSGPDGLPLVFVQDGKMLARQNVVIARTDAQGRFSLTRDPGPYSHHYAVVVVHPDLYAEVDWAAFEANPSITARPWGRIEGVARIGARPVPGAEIRLISDRLRDHDTPTVEVTGKTKADAEGRFVLDRVVPGDTRVTRFSGSGPGSIGESFGTLIEVRAGETIRADIGGRGRPVIARIVPPEWPAPHFLVQPLWESTMILFTVEFPRMDRINRHVPLVSCREGGRGLII